MKSSVSACLAEPCLLRESEQEQGICVPCACTLAAARTRNTNTHVLTHRGSLAGDGLYMNEDVPASSNSGEQLGSSCAGGALGEEPKNNRVQ